PCPGGRPRRPGPDPDGHRRQRRRGRADPLAGTGHLRPGEDGRPQRGPGAHRVSALVPLTVALPLLAAAAIAAFGQFLPGRLENVVATLTAATVGVMATILLLHSARHT